MVSEARARTNASSIVDALLAVSAAEAAAKLRALARVRDAFVFRHDSSPARPSASEYILQEACDSASRLSAAAAALANGSGTATSPDGGTDGPRSARRVLGGRHARHAAAPAAFSLARCTIG